MELASFTDLARNPIVRLQSRQAAPAQGDELYERQRRMPGHRQDALEGARIGIVGAGGIGGWVAVALARAGARSLTIIEHDLVDRSNLSRQPYDLDDLGGPKAHRLLPKLERHALTGAELTAVALPAEDALEEFLLKLDVLIVGVDNNSCRHYCARWARQRSIPAVFTMLSLDGFRCHAFLQGPYPGDPCLWCAVPTLDPDTAAPCAAAMIGSCFFAASFTIFFAFRALMGWPAGVEPFNWREGDLSGVAPELTGRVIQRPDCSVCRLID